MADWYDRNAPGENDHYTQPGDLFRQVLTVVDRQHLVHNIVTSMRGISGPKHDEIVSRQLCHFCRADPGLGLEVAEGLGVDLTRLTPAASRRP
jgi:catalase